MNLVFVYGTLMRKRSNNKYYLEDSSFLGIGSIQGYALYDLGSYPGIRQEKNECTKGEVFEVDDKTVGYGEIAMRLLGTCHLPRGWHFF